MPTFEPTLESVRTHPIPDWDHDAKLGIFIHWGLDWTFNSHVIKDISDLFVGVPQTPEYEMYATAHFRELIARYQPSVLWNDIGYPAIANLPQLFADYYNAVPEGVINDRFIQASNLDPQEMMEKLAKGELGLPSAAHYDFKTPEYTNVPDVTPHKWESCRGIGFSFGINQNDGDANLLSVQDLVHSFVDIVSKNGNLLLNIGPRANGSLPDNQYQRLVGLGDWLATNSVVHLLGYAAPLRWEQRGEHLAVTLPEQLMSVSRLTHITPIGVEEMGDLANSLKDPDVLRLENLDTDLRPPPSALAFTQRAIEDDAANSYLPFFGLDVMRQAAADLVSRQSGQRYDWATECIISAGGLSGILNVLLATLEPGDEVLMTDPIYVGLINRVRLAGGVPRFVPHVPTADGWRLDVDALKKIDPKSVKAALLMSPSMPSGAVLNHDEWHALIDFCQRAGCWLINDAAMERILYDGRDVIHPANPNLFAGMREKVITVGSASKEYRMIGWRVGWVVGPAPIVADVARISISNVVCQTGIAMGAVAAAINDPYDGIATSVAEWQRRRDVLLDALSEFTVIPPHGGWSLFLDVALLGFEIAAASKRLLQVGKIAATPMVNWGSARSNGYVRFVFANEPVARLQGIGERVKRALYL
jgi:aspartate/methionine/tyrosine aminotransferase